jgi:type IV pilus biogenesis protein CpaD/CtpE
MKRIALVMALAALAGCSKGDQKPAASATADTTHPMMMTDTSHMMMGDTSKHMMMADTSKKAAPMAPAKAPEKKKP